MGMFVDRHADTLKLAGRRHGTAHWQSSLRSGQVDLPLTVSVSVGLRRAGNRTQALGGRLGMPVTDSGPILLVVAFTVQWLVLLVV